MIRTTKKERIIINTILYGMGILWIFPVFFAFMGSVKEKLEYNLGNFWDLPQHVSILDNISYISRSADIMQGMGNSLLYALCGSVFAVIIALLASYAIAHLDIKFRMFWFLLIYSGTIFPFQIYLIPVYNGFRTVGLYDTSLAMIIFYTAICIPFSMFVLRNFFIGISKEIVESAKIDGAKDFQVLLSIFIPMSKAPISIVLLSQFTWVWNDLMFGLTFSKSSQVRPVMAAISLMGKDHVPALLTACIIASTTTIILYVILQKNFETGFVYHSK